MMEIQCESLVVTRMFANIVTWICPILLPDGSMLYGSGATCKDWPLYSGRLDLYPVGAINMLTNYKAGSTG